MCQLQGVVGRVRVNNLILGLWHEVCLTYGCKWNVVDKHYCCDICVVHRVTNEIAYIFMLSVSTNSADSQMACNHSCCHLHDFLYGSVTSANNTGTHTHTRTDMQMQTDTDTDRCVHV